MPRANPVFLRISRWIRHRVGKSAEDNPDGAMALYAWLWRSIGNQRGRAPVPRWMLFFFMASLDLILFGGWYVRTRILRTSRSEILTSGDLPSALEPATERSRWAGKGKPLPFKIRRRRFFCSSTTSASNRLHLRQDVGAGRLR